MNFGEILINVGGLVPTALANICFSLKIILQARFGSVFETIKLGSARLAG